MKKKKLKKQLKIILIIIVLILGISLYRHLRVKFAVKEVELYTKGVQVFDDLKLSDLIKSINGELIDDPKIDTSKIGTQEIEFKYITDKHIKVPYTIKIKVIDNVYPIVAYPGVKTVVVGTKKSEFLKSFFCGDNYDNKPKCTVLGDYNLNEVGEYNVALEGEDSSGNATKHPFTLVVREKAKNTTNNASDKQEFTDYTSYSDVVEKYKDKNNKIGIDVSHWQGNLDFKKLKKSKVEFAYIRVGRRDDIEGEFVLDEKFERNIKGFNKVGIPVGVYFYSKANSKKEAIKEAKWVLSQIKKYDVDLEIVFDWENWNNYQNYELSFYNLTEVAKAFTDTVEKKGYKGMLYSSKSYLEDVWFPINNRIWLAHYIDQTNYQGKYKVWQICEDGKVSGIDDNLVDIDIRYE
ncbi:MAG: hypothetical protein IKE63_02365 [Bacilli bacterium]|nr:hypothetical protein [Bacilli bacterium]